ncbi:MAG: hypothetical protein ABIH01_00860 [Candidatus Omnitrophota bacterium]
MLEYWKLSRKWAMVMERGFRQLIDESINRTKEICFRPISVKKWIWLTIIAMLAGQTIGGCNLNIPTSFRRAAIEQESRQPTAQVVLCAEKTAIPSQPPVPLAKRLTPVIIVMFLFLGACGIFAFFLWIWLYSRFNFIFVNAVVNNNASVKQPFLENKTQGNSLFIWEALVSSGFLILLGVLVINAIAALNKAGLLGQGNETDYLKLIAILLPSLTMVITLVVMAMLMDFLLRDFLVPIMYKAKVGIIGGWRRFFSVFGRNKWNLFCYCIVKFGLGIVAAIISAVCAVMIALVVLIPIIIAGLILVFVYRLMGPGGKIIFILCGMFFGIPLALALVFFFNALFIPIPVFFRVFSIKFLGSIDKSYELIPKS